MTDLKADSRKSYEDSGWANGLLGIAYDLVYEARGEYHPEEDAYQDLTKIMSSIEDTDIAIGEDKK